MMPALRELLDVLFASLWQDALIGFCIAAALYAFGARLNAATRYLVLQTALIGMIVVPVVTTLPHLFSGSVTESGQAGAVAGAAAAAHLASSTPVLRRIDVALSDRAVVILTLLWLAGALTFSLRIVLGMAQLSRFVRRSERRSDRGGARIYVSPAIAVPVAFGLLRPAIVVPADIVQAGGDALECVLLHELAHVRRRDAWLHSLERTVHAVLFFNPAVVLLLQSVALEREAACDDWAVAHARNASTYTKNLALLAVRTGVAADMPAACGAMGFGHAIITRIERLQYARRNGSVLLSPYALGGYAFMLAGIALSIQMFAPAIAFSPHTKTVPRTVASASCTHGPMVTYPAPPSAPLPPGTAEIKVSVSPTGTVTAATIAKSSGNAVLDNAAVKAAKESGYEPALQNCKPAAGIYLFRLTSPGAK